MSGFCPISDRGVFSRSLRSFDRLTSGHIILVLRKIRCHHHSSFININRHQFSYQKYANVLLCDCEVFLYTWISWILGTFAGVTFCSNFCSVNFVNMGWVFLLKSKETTSHFGYRSIIDPCEVNENSELISIQNGEKQGKIGRGKQGEETQISSRSSWNWKRKNWPGGVTRRVVPGWKWRRRTTPATQSQIRNQARQLAKHPPSGMVGASSYNQNNQVQDGGMTSSARFQLAGNLQAFPSGQAPVVAEGEIHDNNLGGGNIV